ncbi:enoyl-CoA hydratase-related protein [Paracoccus aerodenitrificans]|uniref:enoyl-CoA hydratase-related protein n=1 Tax=Paracoccus aerodenitrificans TaxID=3017781 RepID=UPI0022F0CE4C|nr:enoyl-CoA hydratase-related protein [Paracoccus aerodenitrificans]
MDFSDIRYDIAAGIATLTLHRPERLNAARIETHEEIQAALSAADTDDDVRVVIVTGEGRAFCAGTDISEGFNLPQGGDLSTGDDIPPDVGGVTVLRLYEMSKPIIAAINGPAIGFGASFTLAMDIRLASENAKFAFPFARRAICAESCSSWFLPRLVGMQTAQDWMLTGRVFGAEEALSRGLVSEVLPASSLLSRAHAIASDIVTNCAPAALALNRKLLWQMQGAAHPAKAHELESWGIAACLSHSDAAEGIAVFREKRAPHFVGQAHDHDFVLRVKDQ